MSLPGAKTLYRSSRWLLGKLVRHAVILGYHRVTDDLDPYRLGVSPARFAEQLEVLARTAQALALDDLAANLGQARPPRRSIVVTFDDGYADVLHRARPLLARLGIPATVFVVSGALGRELWWDRLHRVVDSARALRRAFTLSIGPDPFHWPGDDTAPAPVRLRRALYSLLRPLDQRQRDAALDRLGEILEVPSVPERPDFPRVLTPDELRCLADGDLVRIGAHTVSHAPLSRLSPGGQREEIAESRRDLEALLQRPVTGFSYPFGDVPPGAPALVREAGFEYACQSRNAVVWRGSDRFALPRFWVPDWEGPRFARWLERWLDA